ncbi:MAG: hypothetical protein ABWZ56_07315 [Flavobacterium sp.]
MSVVTVTKYETVLSVIAAVTCRFSSFKLAKKPLRGTTTQSYKNYNQLIVNVL